MVGMRKQFLRIINLENNWLDKCLALPHYAQRGRDSWALDDVLVMTTPQ
jgi:hypothetical protein